MKKAYDFKVLLERLKEAGVEVAEESAKVIVETTFDWTSESAILSENKYDDFLVPFLPKAKAHVLEMAEGINPEDNK